MLKEGRIINSLNHKSMINMILKHSIIIYMIVI